MRHILSHQVIGGKYSKLIVILQQFDLVFTGAKAKNTLLFTELLLDLPIIDPNEIAHEPLLDEAIYLIDTTDPWYGDILVYLQAQQFRPKLMLGDRHHIRPSTTISSTQRYLIPSWCGYNYSMVPHS